MSHDAFVCKSLDNKTIHGGKKIIKILNILYFKGFYIKPNFPGRSSHYCNGGFIVDEEQR